MENFKKVKNLLEENNVDTIIKELSELAKIRELEKGEKYNLKPVEELVKNIKLENENYFDNNIKKTLLARIEEFYVENKEEFTEVYEYSREEISIIQADYLGEIADFNNLEELLYDLNRDYIGDLRACKVMELADKFLEKNEVYKDFYNKELDCWDWDILDRTDLVEQITKNIRNEFYELIFINLTEELEYYLRANLVIYPKQDENFNTEGTELGEIAENIMNYICEEEYDEKLLNSDNAINDLIFSQGYTLGDLADYFNGLATEHSIFLESLIDELENSINNIFLGYAMKVNIEDYFKIREGKPIKYNNGMLGLVDIVNGGGSLMNIELEKPVIFKHNTFDYFDTIQLEGANTYGYSIRDIYGVVEFSEDYEILG